MTLSIAYIWSNYSDLMRVFTPNGGLVREIPLFQGNHRLVKLKKNWPDICRGSPVNNRATFFPRPRPRDSEKKNIRSTSAGPGRNLKHVRSVVGVFFSHLEMSSEKSPWDVF